MVNSSKEGILLQFKEWSEIVLSTDGVVILNVKGDIPICSQDLVLVYKEISVKVLWWQKQSFLLNFC